MPIALVQKERTEKGSQFPEPMRRRPTRSEIHQTGRDDRTQSCV